VEARTLEMWERKKTSKIRRDFGQHEPSIANISGINQDIDERKKALSTTRYLPRSTKKVDGLGLDTLVLI